MPRNPELDLVRLDSYDDPWGTCMTHLFGIATALYCHGSGPPDEWQFRPGGLSAVDTGDLDWPDSEYLERLERHESLPEELTEAGEILLRWRSRIKRAGLDY